VSTMHHDFDDGFLIHLLGLKHVILIPPSQDHNMYRFGKYNAVGNHFSQVDDFDKPDLEAFPRIAEALEHRIDVTLKPGDGLFIPMMWWHQVTALGTDPVCSVNTWADDTPAGHHSTEPLQVADTDADEFKRSNPQPHVRRDLVVAASLEQVKQALTDESAIRRWWNTTFHVSSPGEGSADFMFVGSPYKLDVTIAVTENEVRWRFRGGRQPTVWDNTTATLQLAVAGDEVSIRVDHAGWSGEQIERLHLARAEGLWGHFLESLKRYLAHGEGLPFGEW
jgi:uncharacterized protein YndB with AHSA1/START domain